MTNRPKRTTASSPACGGGGFTIRKASMRDIVDLLRLINGYAAEGVMLPRTEFEISENIRDFSVIHEGDRLAGCAALHFYTTSAGEIRSLAVAPEFQKRHAGRLLVEALLDEAKAFSLQSVFAFTYIPAFFQRLGFSEIERGELPLKAWKDCLRCPKFQCCDEIAVIIHMESPGMRVTDTPICAEASARDGNGGHPVPQLPILKLR